MSMTMSMRIDMTTNFGTSMGMSMSPCMRISVRMCMGIGKGMGRGIRMNESASVTMSKSLRPSCHSDVERSQSHLAPWSQVLVPRQGGGKYANLCLQLCNAKFCKTTQNYVNSIALAKHLEETTNYWPEASLGGMHMAA